MPKYNRSRTSYSGKPEKVRKQLYPLFSGSLQSNTISIDPTSGALIGSLLFKGKSGSLTVPESVIRKCAIFDPLRHVWFFANSDPLWLWVRANSLQFANIMSSPDPTDLSTDMVVSFSESHCEDNPTPGFKKRSSNGEVICTPFLLEKVVVNQSIGHSPTLAAPGTATFAATQLSGKLSGSVYFDTPPKSLLVRGDVALTSSDLNFLERFFPTPPVINAGHASNSAWSRMDAGTLESLVNVGEARETVNHLLSVLSRIINIYRTIRKGKFSRLAPKTFARWQREKALGKASSIADFIGDAWLEARYAWRPLFIDAHNVASLLKSDHKLSDRKTFRGYDSESVEGVTGEEIVLPVSGGSLTGTVKRRSASTEVRAGVLAHARMESALTNELGLQNLAGAAWELIPFSFIIDWFVDLSGIISMITANASWKPLASWYTYIEKSEYEIIFTHLNSLPLSTPLRVASEKVVKRREIGDFRTGPIINVNLDTSKLLDLLFIGKKLL